MPTTSIHDVYEHGDRPMSGADVAAPVKLIESSLSRFCGKASHGTLGASVDRVGASAKSTV